MERAATLFWRKKKRRWRNERVSHQRRRSISYLTMTVVDGEVDSTEIAAVLAAEIAVVVVDGDRMVGI